MQRLVLGLMLLAVAGCGVEGRLYLPGEKPPPPKAFESKEEEPVNRMQM